MIRSENVKQYKQKNIMALFMQSNYRKMNMTDIKIRHYLDNRLALTDRNITNAGEFNMCVIAKPSSHLEHWRNSKIYKQTVQSVTICLIHKVTTKHKHTLHKNKRHKAPI